MRPPAKPEPTLEASCERFIQVERSIELARSTEFPERARLLNDLAHERRDVLACAASRLPAKGPTAQWFHDALEGAWGEPTQHFAIYVAWHAKEFPKRYVEPVVRWALRAKEYRLITQVSTWNGAIPVFDAMTVAVKQGEIGYADRRFCEYYVRARKDEDPAQIKQAHTRLREASFHAPDAPPGVRYVGD